MPIPNEAADPVVQGQIGQWLAGAAGAAVAVVLAVQKLMRGWSADRAARAIDDAQADVVQGLSNEIQRLRNQNTELANELNQTQLRIARLVAENARQQAEIEALLSRLSALGATHTTTTRG